MISTGITSTSWKRQDFLIIGKDRSSILGLIVFLTVISANHNEELTLLAQALQPLLIIPENTPIAKAIALPPNAIEQVSSIVSQQISAECADMKTHVLWIQQKSNQPQITCNLTYEKKKTITITGMLDMDRCHGYFLCFLAQRVERDHAFKFFHRNWRIHIMHAE